MKRRIQLVAVALGAVLALAGCSTAGDAGGTTSTPKAAAPDYAAPLQKAIRETMAANAIPGVTVLIDSPKRGDWSGVFGTAELGKTVPPSLDDYFRVGSNTKTMTSTVILQLVQEGALALDDPISTFVPEVPNGAHITIAQLSEMRSGLFSYTFDTGFNETLDADPGKAWTPDELLAIAFSHPADFAPGTQYEYSNTNIVLLGKVIEKLTGMSASEAFEKRIFEPLGMTHTSLPANTDRTLPSPHAQGYQFGTNVATIDSYAVPAAQLPAARDGTLQPLDDTDDNPSWAWTAGGAISTSRDLAVYVKALVGGGLLDAKTQKLRMDSIQPITPGETSGVGYGLGIARFAPGIIGHDGQLPGYSSFMVYDTTTGDTIIIAANLSASPVDGENAAVVLGKAALTALYGASVIAGDAAGHPTTTPTPTPTP